MSIAEHQLDPERRQVDIVAVGAHPDDVEIGCGGTLAKLVEQGHSVGIVDLTDGEPTPASPSPDVRIAEAMEAARVLGIQQRIIMELPNRRLFDNFETRVALATIFRRLRPKLVLSLGIKTPMASPDHWQAAQITDAAVFYSRLTKWDEHFDQLPVHTIQRQLYYSLFFESEWSGSAARQFVSDISGQLDTKLDAVRCYKTQFPPQKNYIFSRVTSMAHAIGASAGFEAGEVLTCTKAIGITDVMANFVD